MSYSPDDSDWDDDEPDDDWEDDDLEASTIPCPKCGIDIYEDAVRCPLCGEYITRTHSVWSDKPWWWKLVGLLGIIAMIWGLAFAFGR